MLLLFALLALPSMVQAAVGQYWEWENPIPQGNTLNAVAWNGSNLYVAVGDRGTVMTSPDAVSWMASNVGNTNRLTAAAWGNGRFVAADDMGGIVTSPDGGNWTPRTSNSNYYGISGLVWNGSEFVAVGGGGVILTSPDGITWTSIVPGAGSAHNLSAVGWNGMQFVAVGQAGTVRTSPDGIHWTTRTSGTTADLAGVVWAGAKWVAVGGNTVLTSADGITWTAQTGVTSNFLLAVGCKSSELVALGGNVTLTSADGVSWTQHNNVTYRLNALLWNGSEFVAVGDGGKIAVSTDGSVWTSRTQNVLDVPGRYEPSVGGIGWFAVKGEFVAVTNQGLVLRSRDGLHWSVTDTGIGNNLSALDCTSTECVAVGAGGHIATSLDAATWTPQTSGTSNTLYDVAWDAKNAQFVAVGANGTILTSADGAAWVAQSSGTTQNLFGVHAGGGGIVAVGGNGTILTSADGTVWNARTSGATSRLSAITFGGGKYVAVTQLTGKALISADGVTWTPYSLPSFAILDTVIWDGKYFFAGGPQSPVFVSSDGMNWTSYDTGADPAPLAIATNGNANASIAVMGGFSGSILASVQPAPTGLQAVTVTQPGPGSETFNIQGMSSLTVAASSGNQTLLPDAGIAGASTCRSAGSCTLTLHPAAGRTGTAAVTVTVTDGHGQSGKGTFQVTVGPPPPPSASGFSNITIAQPNGGSEKFAVTGSGTLTVTVHSGNQGLLPDANIGGAASCTSAGNCVLTLQPVAQQAGTAAVGVTVSDAYGQSSGGTFTVSVKAAPSAAGGGGGGLGPWMLLGLLGLLPWRLRRRVSRRV